MTPTKGYKETLVTATTLQCVRVKVKRKDRETAFVTVTVQSKEDWTHNNKINESVTFAANLISPHTNQLDWTREDGHLDVDTDVESNDEEDDEEEDQTHENEEKTYTADENVVYMHSWSQGRCSHGHNPRRRSHSHSRRNHW